MEDEITREMNSQVQVRSEQQHNFERLDSFLFLGVVTAVSVVCVRYGSYMDAGELTSQYVLTQATYGSRLIKRETVLRGVK